MEDLEASIEVLRKIIEHEGVPNSFKLQVLNSSDTVILHTTSQEGIYPFRNRLTLEFKTASEMGLEFVKDLLEKELQENPDVKIEEIKV